MSLGMVLLQGPTGWRFLISQLLLYRYAALAFIALGRNGPERCGSAAFENL